MMKEISRTTPFRANIKERFRLSKEGSNKDVHHVVLDISDASIAYNVGDSVGIYPEHHPELVKKTLVALHATGKEVVYDKEGKSYSFADFLSFKANITTTPTKLLKEVAVRQKDAKKKAFLTDLLSPDRREQRKAFLEEREVWDLLEENPEVFFTPQEICDLLQPLLPRFYSIASSQKHVGDEIHLTVAHIQYQTGGKERRGVCSHYLCHVTDTLAPTVPIYIQPVKNFALPKNPNADLIMIGPGTGIAPFRGFLQERYHRGDTGRNWLFFGEQTRDHDFSYEEEWIDYQEKGLLEIDLAFSRDQSEKVYVQHKMQRRGKELFSWIDAGAYLFVCGDAKRMAKDVDATLHAIVGHYGKQTEEGAKEYVKRLRKEGRYLRDVY